jgi:UDP-N-acetylglucosamine--dolichyl-phosphate N-acetylglucosaminephosphotransferase
VYAAWQLHSRQSPFAHTLSTVFALAVAAFAATMVLIPPIAELNKKAELFGIDINKRALLPAGREPDKMYVMLFWCSEFVHFELTCFVAFSPESAGIVPGTIFIICLTLCQLFYASTPSQLVEYTAALSSITFIVFLGFADDVLDLRWRYKLLLPPVASLSLLLAYAGSTTVIVPLPFRAYLGGLESVDLGIFYRLYMLLLTTFCSNAINILAGLNGLEVGQSVIIACSVLLHNLIELGCFGVSATTSTMPDAVSVAAFQRAHLFSAMVILLFLAVSLALWTHNWYPSRVFVGDTFTYFAGVVFAVCGILGHFSKTLLLFFIPQILNFLYSLPQLIGIVHCPRHRLPRLNVETGKLEAIPSNLNLINLALLLLGPQTEKDLCTIMLVFQIVCCAGGMFVRYFVSQILY